MSMYSQIMATFFMSSERDNGTRNIDVNHHSHVQGSLESPKAWS